MAIWHVISSFTGRMYGMICFCRGWNTSTFPFFGFMSWEWNDLFPPPARRRRPSFSGRKRSWCDRLCSDIMSYYSFPNIRKERPKAEGAGWNRFWMRASSNILRTQSWNVSKRIKFVWSHSQLCSYLGFLRKKNMTLSRNEGVNRSESVKNMKAVRSHHVKIVFPR